MAPTAAGCSSSSNGGGPAPAPSTISGSGGSGLSSQEYMLSMLSELEVLMADALEFTPAEVPEAEEAKSPVAKKEAAASGGGLVASSFKKMVSPFSSPSKRSQTHPRKAADFTIPGPPAAEPEAGAAAGGGEGASLHVCAA